MSRFISLMVVLVLWLSFGLVTHAAEPIASGQFDKLRAVIRPQVGEDQWAAISWRTDLWEARKQAAAQGKPILLWEMDGHPLGCG